MKKWIGDFAQALITSLVKKDFATLQKNASLD